MNNGQQPAMPYVTYEDYQCTKGAPANHSITKQRAIIHGGLTKREHFAASLPHLEVNIQSLEVMSELIGREVNQNDPLDILKATAEFEAILRVMRADAHLKQLEETK